MVLQKSQKEKTTRAVSLERNFASAPRPREWNRLREQSYDTGAAAATGDGRCPEQRQQADLELERGRCGRDTDRPREESALVTNRPAVTCGQAHWPYAGLSSDT